jgi:2-oxopent-4-enoate/cis-2-oxohex-4-enoate hydratase
MTEPDIEQFIAARRGPRVIEPPSATRALSLAEAYQVQDRLRDALVARGESVIGWKAGFTARSAQAMFQVTEPVSGFLLASGVFPSGADVPLARFAAPGIEAEVAFVLGEDLAGPGITAPRALLATRGALPALELVDFRHAGKPAGTDIVADGVYASGIVLGGALTAVGAMDLALEGLVLELNGAVAATNTAAEVMGSPANALAWIANHLGARGLKLRAGDIVMTGSVSAVLRPKAGDTVRATFTRLGSVGVRFA